jgi:diacylglycerol kinase family enzyme
MKLIVVTSGDGPESREAISVAEDMRTEGFEVDTIDWESDEATTTAKLYDIYSMPAFIVVSGDGSLIERWQGSQRPMMSDIEHLM